MSDKLMKLQIHVPLSAIDDEGNFPIACQVIACNHEPLTPEENEACAVLVECMRRDFPFEYDGNLPDYPFWVNLASFAATPSEAYHAALEAEGQS